MRFKKLPSQEYLKELFDYNEEEGKLIWIKRGRGRKFGEEAGCNCDRYRMISIDKSYYKTHRLIWMYCYGEDPEDLEVEHRDRNDFNNRLSNLRLATTRQNSYNKSTSVSNNSGYKGVTWIESRCRWRADITTEGKLEWLGDFDCPEEAYEEYLNASKKKHGEFACGGTFEVDPVEAARRRKLNDEYKERKNEREKTRGVSWDKTRKKWLVRKDINKKQKNLGRFNTFEEAKAAYDNA